MKRTMSLVMAIVMLACLLCMPAYAERTGSDTPNQSVDAEVQVRVNENDIVHKYSVDIDYADVMVFTYTKTGTWDPDAYTYSNVSGSWDKKEVKVTNHSDMPIKYTAVAEATVTTYGELDIVVSNASGTIDACYPGIVQGSRNVEMELTISGTPNDKLGTTAVKLGNLTISITNP